MYVCLQRIQSFVSRCCSCTHSGTMRRSGCGPSPHSWLCKQKSSPELQENSTQVEIGSRRKQECVSSHTTEAPRELLIQDSVEQAGTWPSCLWITKARWLRGRGATPHTLTICFKCRLLMDRSKFFLLAGNGAVCGQWLHWKVQDIASLSSYAYWS